MDPAVAAALVAGGWTVIATLGTQFLAGRREAAHERTQAQREERNQWWDTNRERLIELRALLDTSAVTLMACEKAVEDLRTAVMLNQELQIQVPSAKEDRVAGLDRELDELEGRLALRLGTTQEVTRAFTLASHALSDGYLRLSTVVAEAAVTPETDVTRDPARRSMLADSLDKAQGDARKYRQQFFERARTLVGVQDRLRDAPTERALPPGGRPLGRTGAKELDEQARRDEPSETRTPDG